MVATHRCLTVSGIAVFWPPVGFPSVPSDPINSDLTRLDDNPEGLANPCPATMSGPHTQKASEEA